MQPCQGAILDQTQRVFEHFFGLGGKAGNDIGAKGHVRSQAFGLLAKGNRIFAQMPPFHAFKNHIVPSLQAEMQMRH